MWVRDLWQDATYAWRLLRKGVAFTIVAVCSLALGIGANTAIFSTTKTILLDSLAVPRPDQLRLLRWEFPGGQPMYSVSGDLEQTKSGTTTISAFSYPIYQALTPHSDEFENIAAFAAEPRKFVAIVDTDAELVSALLVSGNFFTTLGVTAGRGRNLLPSDDRAGGGSVAEISDAYWARRFGRSPAIIGSIIQLNRIPVTIIGVVPATFTGPQRGTNPDVYIPLSMDGLVDPQGDPLVSIGLAQTELTDGERWWLALIGRVKPHVTDSEALGSLQGVFAQAVQSTLQQHHKNLDRLHLSISPGNRGIRVLQNQFSQTAPLLILIVGLVLLLACANVANLLLARSEARKREISLRLALGAKRTRIVRQMLTENISLALLGGLAGLGVGYLARNLVPYVLHENITVNFDWQVMAFALAISLLTGILFGGFPAWHATLTDIKAGLQQAARSTQRSKALMGRSLVAIQLCLSVVLLIGAGLFLQTLNNLFRTQLGFQPEHLLLFDLNLPQTRYATDQSRTGLFQGLQVKLAALPGVRTVTFSDSALLAGNTSTTNFDPDMPDSSKDKKAWLNVVGTNFFGTMGIPLIAGREFANEDSASAPKVAVINLRLAQELFSHTDPIGTTFNDDHIRIIGICGNSKFKDLRMEPPPTYYLLYSQFPKSNSVTFAVKTAVLPSSVAGEIRNAVLSLDNALPVTNIRTQEQQINATLGQEKLFAGLVSGFALLALLLASIGLYGITAYSVSRRTKEIGIRMALGAQKHQILSMILRETLWLALIGLGLGLAISLIIGKALRSLLYGIRPGDPLTLIATSTILISVALAASWLPARRATHLEPLNALHQE